MKHYAVRPDISSELHKNLENYNEKMRKLLAVRGITNAEQAQQFLDLVYERDFHDPLLLPDMRKAVARIKKAIESGEKILIYSDYDADGIPAAVILFDFFELIQYKNVEVYIPHRHNEGYGLHLEAVTKFKDQGFTLLITLDCGIVDNAEILHAQEAGIDVIVTDHHEPGETLPEAHAIINPKRKDSVYPYRELCGSGVGFKLVQALIQEYKEKIPAGQEKWLLDMAGIATLSDMVPITGENRAIAYFGLKVLRKSRRPGLVALLSKIKVSQKYLSEDDIGFMITPRINAASRMAVPRDAFLLLSTKDEKMGKEYAEHLDSLNQERKSLVAVLVKEVKKILKEREEHFKDKKIIVIGNPAWRPALLGLAANSVAEELGKPVFMWGREGGTEIKGSARSGNVASVVEIMHAVKEYFHEYGGHTHSGGFSIISEKIHTFEQALNDVFLKIEQDFLEKNNTKENISELGGESNINQNTQDKNNSIVDDYLTLDEITPAFFKDIEKLGPFGKDNLKPVFLIKNVRPDSVKLFGKTKEHTELTFKKQNGSTIRAIAFFLKPEDFSFVPKPGEACSLVANLEQSYFMNKLELRLRLIDII
jgi:single-stranded-DNA-specific exonuclease